MQDSDATGMKGEERLIFSFRFLKLQLDVHVKHTPMILPFKRKKLN